MELAFDCIVHCHARADNGIPRREADAPDVAEGFHLHAAGMQVVVAEVVRLQMNSRNSCCGVRQMHSRAEFEAN